MSSVNEPGDEVAVEPEVLEDDDERGLAVMEAQARDLADRNIEVRFTDAQKEIVKAINPDANPAELQVFLYHAARTGLDPIAKQIYLVKRDGKMAIQTGIDGYRLVAARTGQMAGSDEPVFTEDDQGNIIKATVTVYRIAADGIRYPYTATAWWSEYAPANMDAPAAFMWKKMRHTMIAKCAEALAIRKAFPAELSGIYTDDEMGQADFSQLGRRQAAEVVTSEYNCPKCLEFGKVVKVVDNRKAQEASTAERKPPAWKCSAQSKCGDGKGKWGWGSWDPNEFAEWETGGTTITVTQPAPAQLTAAEAEKAWDAADPQRPFTQGEQAAPPTQASSPPVSAGTEWVETGVGSPPATSSPGEVTPAEALANTKEILGAHELDPVERFANLLALVEVPATTGGNDALRARLETICRLMNEEGIWPFPDALARLLKAWPQVDSWTVLTRSGKAAVLKFAEAVQEKAKQDIVKALSEEATRG